MDKEICCGSRRGCVRAPASKSQLHRLLICAALGRREVTLRCGELSADTAATASCLRALGAGIRETEPGVLAVKPIPGKPDEICCLPCGESAATLRFLLPLVGALGAEARFSLEGRLPERPLLPLAQELRAHGMKIEERGCCLLAGGRLRSGSYLLPGNVSSQFISGLLLALPLLEGDSTLAVMGETESEAYIRVTEDLLLEAGITVFRQAGGWRIPGGQRYELPNALSAEGDWSSAAFFLCAGAFSRQGIGVRGLSLRSCQADRAVLELLRDFGALVTETEDQVWVRAGQLSPREIDGAQIPDLIPVLSVLAAAAPGESRIVNAGRLRWKESDRLRSLSVLLRSLGADVTEERDGLRIRGRKRLNGGEADSAGDHRIAMAGAMAACICREPVRICGAECVVKSYPRFWRDWESLEVEA